MRICPKCNKEIENDKAKFCKFCGTKLPEAPTEEVKEKVGRGDNKEEQPPVIIPPYEDPREEDELTSHKDGNSGKQDENTFSRGEKAESGQTGNQYSSNQGTVLTGSADVPTEQVPKPNSYLALSILTTALCCWPLGIYAIVCSSRVDSYYKRGNYNAAREESTKAKKWSIISAILGFIAIAISSLIIIIGAMADEADKSGSYIYDDTDDIAVYDDEAVCADSCAVDEYYEEEDPVSTLRSMVDVAQSTLPQNVSDGMVMTDIELEGDYLVYTYECDEEIMDIDLLNENKEATKSGILSILRDDKDDEDGYLEVCKQARKGISYKYVGDISGKQCIIRVTYRDLINL